MYHKPKLVMQVGEMNNSKLNINYSAFIVSNNNDNTQIDSIMNENILPPDIINNNVSSNVNNNDDIKNQAYLQQCKQQASAIYYVV